MGYINDQEWNRYNTNINDLSEITLKDFQFEINNKILVTKTFLHKIRKVEDNLCSYCKREPETILHLYVECDKVKEFWQPLHIWLMQNVNISINLDKNCIFFSYQGKCILKNYIMVVAKHYIYKNKFSAKQLNINSFISFISMLKVKFQCERYIANINNKIAKLLKKWTPFYNHFNNNQDNNNHYNNDNSNNNHQNNG